MGEIKYFFSYARKDSGFVLQLAGELRAAGVNLWLDQTDIIAGQRWDRAIEDALKNCQGMILILSPEALASDNVMDEVSYALEESKLVVPVLLQHCDIPFRLRRLQHIDFTSDYNDGFSRLVGALHIEKSSEGKEHLVPQEHGAHELADAMKPTSPSAGDPGERGTARQTVVVVGDNTADQVAAQLRQAQISVTDDRGSIESSFLVVIADDASDGPLPIHREIARDIAASKNHNLLWIVTRSSEVDDPELLELVVLEVRDILGRLKLVGDTIQVALDDESSRVDVEPPCLKGWAAIIRFVNYLARISQVPGDQQLDFVPRGKPLQSGPSHKRFRTELYVLTADEGGRHTPFFAGYRPEISIGGETVRGAVILPEGISMAMPGDTLAVTIVLERPVVLQAKLRFEVKEGSRTVGKGVVATVFD